MTWQDLVTVAACCLTLAANGPYILAVARGQSPRLASWAVWTAAMTVGAVQAARAGQVPGAAFTAVCAAGCGAILAFGWQRGDRQMGRLDVACGAGGLAGVVLLAASAGWPSVVPLAAAVAVSVATDLCAFIPTFAAGWRGGEPWLPFAMFAAGAAGTLTVAEWSSPAGWIYPAYEVTACTAMAGLALAGSRIHRDPPVEKTRRDGLPAASVRG